MTYVFFGTPLFADIILEKLIHAGFVPEIVVCNPDRPVGRKKLLTAPAVKQRIMNYELGIRERIKILQPEKLDPSLFIIPNSLFDVFIVAAYGKIIPKEILAIPRLGVINVHPSLLPKYRGPTPIQSAILNGDEETGVTLMLMDEQLDHGPVLAQRKLNYELGTINYGTLYKELAGLGADLMIETLPKFMKGEITPHPQDESQATYTKKFTMSDGYVDLAKDSPVIIERKVRALNPEPGVWTRGPIGPISPMGLIGQKKRVKILEVKVAEGKLKLKKIQVEGKKSWVL